MGEGKDPIKRYLDSLLDQAQGRSQSTERIDLSSIQRHARFSSGTPETDLLSILPSDLLKAAVHRVFQEYPDPISRETVALGFYQVAYAVANPEIVIPLSSLALKYRGNPEFLIRLGSLVIQAEKSRDYTSLSGLIYDLLAGKPQNPGSR